jgi:hypothetical protein
LKSSIVETIEVLIVQALLKPPENLADRSQILNQSVGRESVNHC